MKVNGLLLNYYQKMELTNQIFSSACQKINEFKKDKEIIIYGGGRLLLGFFDSGLEPGYGLRQDMPS